MIDGMQLRAARILLAYAARTARIVPSDIKSEVLRLILQAKTGALSIQDELSLNDQVTKLTTIVAPTDLAAAQAALITQASDWSSRVASATATCVNVFGILLTLFIMSLTTGYTMITADLQDLRPDTTKYLESIEDVYVKSQPRHTRPGMIPGQLDDMAAQQLNDNIEKVREWDGAMSSAVKHLSSMVRIEGNGLNYCTLILQMIGNATACLPAATTLGVGAPPSAGTVLAATPSLSSSSPVLDEPSPSLLPDSGGLVHFRKVQASKVGYAEAIGLNLTGPNQITTVYAIRSKGVAAATMLGTALLPLLYGFLGSAVFLMRQYFGETRFFQTTDHVVGRVMLRLGLGGVAGLAIGWFWSPASTKLVSDATTFSMTPFALAFLAGFSIELLFSILDRIIAAVSPPAKPV